MERKEYTGRCKVYAMAKAAQNQRDLERVKVRWKNRTTTITCYPKAYKLGYKPDGTPIHTAILIDCTNGKCQYDVLLDEVEAENGG